MAGKKAIIESKKVDAALADVMKSHENSDEDGTVYIAGLGSEEDAKYYAADCVGPYEAPADISLYTTDSLRDDDPQCNRENIEGAIAMGVVAEREGKQVFQAAHEDVVVFVVAKNATYAATIIKRAMKKTD